MEGDKITSILSKPDIDFKDDFRQAFIVAKYEIMKFMSGKKILIFGVINALVLALMAVVIFAFDIDLSLGMENYTAAQGGIALFLSVSSYLMLLGATLFSATSLVSEFEERTALVLFTKPIRKGSIFMGKMMASFALNLIFLVLYYAIASIVIGIKTGEFTANVFPSLGYCTFYILALTGIAMLFSALMKKSSSASILTFIFILLVPGIITVIIDVATLSSGGNAPDLWFMLNIASGSITDSIAGSVSNGPRDALVMLIWGLVPLIGSYLLFRRREV